MDPIFEEGAAFANSALAVDALIQRMSKLSAEQRIVFWSGFVAMASGRMAGTIGHAAAFEILQMGANTCLQHAAASPSSTH